MMIDRAAVIERGFKRGSVIDLASLLQKTELPKQVMNWVGDDIETCWAIITLYDCALVHTSLDAEPWFYVAIAKQIEKTNGTYTHAKHEREIHFELKLSGNSIFLKCTAAGCNFPIDRSLINGAIEPLDDAEIVNLEDLLTWVSERTIRSTFEDAFNEEYKKKAEKVFDDSRMTQITSVLMQIDRSREKSDKDIVKIALTCLDTLSKDEYIALESGSRPGVRNDKSLIERMKEIFCSHEDPDECDCHYEPHVYLCSEGELPVGHLRTYQKWSPDFFTLKQPAEKQAVAPMFGNRAFPES